MRYYLLNGFNLVAHVPADATKETVVRCERLRQRVVDAVIFNGEVKADRCLGVIDGGKK